MNSTISYFDLENNFHPSPQNKNFVIVPTSKLKLVEVDLPGSEKIVIRALPFYLEEELANDLSENFFCVFGKSRSNKSMVAVLLHNQMKIWLDKLKSTPYEKAALIPDTFFLPEPDKLNEGATIGVINNQVLIRTSECEVLALNSNLPKKVIETQLNNEKFDIIHYYEDIENSDFQLDFFADHLVRKLLFSNFSLPSIKNFNLRQGEYKVKKNMFGLIEWSIRIAVLAFILATIITINKYLDNQHLAEQTKNLRAQNMIKSQELFPELKNSDNLISDLLNRISSMKLYQANENEQQLNIKLLKNLLNFISKQNDIEVKKIEYFPTQIILFLNTKNNFDLPQLTSQLNQNYGANNKWKFTEQILNSKYNAKIIAEKI